MITSTVHIKILIRKCLGNHVICQYILSRAEPNFSRKATSSQMKHDILTESSDATLPSEISHMYRSD